VNRNTLLGIGAALVVVAGLAGYVIGYRRGLDAGQGGMGAMVAGPAPGMPAGMPGGLPGGMPPGAMPPGGGPAMPTADLVQRIDVGRRLVAADPGNRAAWVQLGNDYFDTHQREKAIEAYGKALALDPNDANVITDQGVMYRELGDFDRAIASFEKASKIDPTHVQSLFNLGVVWSADKKDPARAAAAWRKVIEVAPQSSQAEQARQSLAGLGKAPGR
jgi:tetratricopeptide (TPR) repeat protein